LVLGFRMIRSVWVHFVMRKSTFSLFFFVGLVAGCTLGCAPSISKPSADQQTNQARAIADQSQLEIVPSAISSVVDSKIELLEMNFEAIQAFIESKQGAIVVVDMWATWCPPCVKEFPNLVKLQAKHDLNDLVCISVSFDFQGIDPIGDVRMTVSDFLHSKGAENVVNVLSTEESDVLSRKLGIASIPVVYVYDRAGNLVRRFSESNGRHEGYAEIDKLVSELIDAK